MIKVICLALVILSACSSNTKPGDNEALQQDSPVIESLTTSQQPAAIEQNEKDSVTPVNEADTPLTCAKTLLTTVENFKVWKLNNTNAIVFSAKMSIDADGSPNAYCPDNKGLDFTANAGKPGNWFGIVTNSNGEPVIQKSTDPSPGCFVSPTTLTDSKLSAGDPLKYVNAEKIPYIVLPSEVLKLGKIKIGDFAFVYNTKNDKNSFAIFADGGPAKKLGEGSVFLAEQLGINKSPRNGGVAGGILYLVFPNTGKGNGTLRTLDEINETGKMQLENIGGIKIIDCLK